jgi:hypothetical protein
MWPSGLLEILGPTLLSKDKLGLYYREYVKGVLIPQWTGELERLSSLIDLRDFAEDTLSLLSTNFQCAASGAVPIDQLVKALKLCTDLLKRRRMTSAFIEENALAMKNIQASHGPFVNFAISCELKSYFDVANALGKIRPILKCSVDTIEAVIKKIEASELTLDFLKEVERDLGVTSLWPVLALIQAHQDGEVEELFLHVPMPKVFGAPSCVRNSLSKNKTKFPITAGVKIDNAVIASKTSLCFKTSSGWTTHSVKIATLVASLPNRRAVWCLDPGSMKAAIYSIDPFETVLEFDLPQDLKNQLQEILVENLGIESQLAVSVETIEKVYEDMMSFFAGKREQIQIFISSAVFSPMTILNSLLI